MENNSEEFKLCYADCLNIAPIEKVWIMAQMEYSPDGKVLWFQGNIASWVISPMEKAWFYKRLFFEVVIAIVKDKKYTTKDTMLIKFCFMHYM